MNLEFELGLQAIPRVSLGGGRNQWAALPRGAYRIHSRNWRFAGDDQGEGVLVQVNGAPTQELTLAAIGPALDDDD